jgi:PPK2 family polyphosphate:nucleotide phosphotransferase
MSRYINLSKISTLPTKTISKEEAINETSRLIKTLAEIQDKLYAQKKYSVIIVLQGMDTAGKDGAVKNVFSGVNPGGCNVKSFKTPSLEETSHQFLWRVSKECPEKGMIQIFNRSHYEDVLMPKVNNQLNKNLLKERCDEINVFERGLIMNDAILIKFFLHISHVEQLKRLNARKTDVRKRWKFQKGDIVDIAKHNKYIKAYEFIFKECSKPNSWKIIPADKKWYKNYFILSEIVNELKKYNIDYPDLKIRNIT